MICDGVVGRLEACLECLDGRDHETADAAPHIAPSTIALVQYHVEPNDSKQSDNTEQSKKQVPRFSYDTSQTVQHRVAEAYLLLIDNFCYLLWNHRGCSLVLQFLLYVLSRFYSPVQLGKVVLLLPLL